MSLLTLYASRFSFLQLLLHGRASKASDVYAFGILLWELATGRRPYSGTPVGMLAHKVVQQGWRPAWPGGCSMPVKLLVESCWTQDPADRCVYRKAVEAGAIGCDVCAYAG
jgi:serine/threonine protein kinase